APRSTLFPYTTLFRSTVNSSNLLTWAHGDDGLDVDQQYTGTISNAVVIQGDEPGSAFELDGPEGTTNGTPFIMKDITVFGNGKRSEEHTSELQSRENL